jgi:hypothetical protein
VQFRNGKGTNNGFSDMVLMSWTMAQFVQMVMGLVTVERHRGSLVCFGITNLVCVQRYKSVGGFTHSTYTIYTKKGLALEWARRVEKSGGCNWACDTNMP